jgi:hypothetical protein
MFVANYYYYYYYYYYYSILSVMASMGSSSPRFVGCNVNELKGINP